MPREIGALVAIGAFAGVFAVSGCGGSRSLSLPCAPRPSGALCIKVFQDGRTVRDAIAYLSASHSPLAGRRWRLALATYPCNPGTASVPSCRPAAIYPGPIRRGNPPIAVYCRRVNSTSTAVMTTPEGCHDTLAQELASLGDFAGFKPPKSFNSRVWFCVSEQLVTRPPPTWLPARACAEVSA